MELSDAEKRKASTEEFKKELLDLKENTEESSLKRKGDILQELSNLKTNMPSLQDYDLSFADLCGVDLSDTSLCDTKCYKTLFIGADLSNCDFEDSLLVEANFGGANLYGIDATNADCTGANFAKADLAESSICGANFTGVDLSCKSDLTNADFNGANLSKANLKEANVLDTDFSGANLRGVNLVLAENLTCEQVKSSEIDRETKLPSYIKVTWLGDEEYECEFIPENI